MKTYKIEGFELKTVKCSPSRAMTFVEKLYSCNTAEKKANLAKSILVPVKAESQEAFDNLDFINEVDLDDINKVLDDFFLRSTGRTIQQMNDLIESSMKKTLESITGNGLKSGKENEDIPTLLPPLPTSTP